MPIGREVHYTPSPTVEDAAFVYVGGKDPELAGLSRPVDGKTHAAMLGGLEIVVDIAFGIVEMDDALVAPEVDGDRLQAGEVGTKVRDGRVLHMAEVMVLEDLAVHIGEEHTLVAGGTEEAGGLAHLVGHNGDAVCVVFDRVFIGPEFGAVIVE